MARGSPLKLKNVKGADKSREARQLINERK